MTRPCSTEEPQLTEEQKTSVTDSRLDRILNAAAQLVQSQKERILPAVFAVTVAALGGVVVYAVVRSLSWPLANDTPVFHFIGWRILSGDIPYREIYDLQMPGTYLFHMLAITLFGPGDVGFRLFDLMWVLAGAGGIIVFSGKRRGVYGPVIAVLVYMAMELRNGPHLTGQREIFMCPFLFFNLYLAALATENGKRHAVQLALAGFLLGVAMTVKPTIVILAALVCAAFVCLHTGEFRQRIRGTVVFLSCFCIAPAGIAVWLWSVGGLADFWEMLTRFLPVYAKHPSAGYQGLLSNIFSQGAPVLPTLVLVPLALNTEHADRKRIIYACIGVLYGLLHYVVQNKGFSYHLFIFYGMLMLLFGVTVSPLMKEKRFHIRATTISLVIITAFSVMFPLLARARSDQSLDTVKPYVNLLAQDLRALSLEQDDTVEIMDTIIGGLHTCYILKQRKATRFIGDLFFYVDIDNPYIMRLRREYVETLTRERPKAIMLSNLTFGDLNKSRIRLFPELEHLLQNSYTVAVDRGGYTLYTLVP